MNLQSIEFQKAARQRALADALSQQALTPRQVQQGMPITPAMGFGEGATQLVQALMAKRANRKADQMMADAEGNEARRREALARALTPNQGESAGVIEDAAGGPATPMQSQVMPQENRRQQMMIGLLRGLPPEQADALLSSQVGQMFTPEKLERVDLGNAIGVMDTAGRIVRRIPKGVSPDVDLREQGETARWGTPSANTVYSGGVSMRNTHQNNRQSAENAALAARTSIENSARGSGSQEKMPVLDSLDYISDRFGKVFDKVGTGPIRGRISGVTDYGDAVQFDNLREQLSTEMRTLFRIPGEGTLSDKEQAQYGLQLPDRRYPRQVNEQILSDITNRARLRMGLPIDSSGGRSGVGMAVYDHGSPEAAQVRASELEAEMRRRGLFK